MKSQTILGIILIIIGAILSIIGMLFLPNSLAALIWGVILLLIGLFLIIFRNAESQIEQVKPDKPKKKK